jgi:hypothetical protein
MERGTRLPRRRLADVVGGVRDRLEGRRDTRKPQPPGVRARPVPEVVARLDGALGADAAALLAEPALAELEAMLAARLETDREGRGDPYPADFKASRTLARLCWTAVRLLRPDVVVETGVAAGYTSAHIAAALEQNGHGELHSIDPVLGGPDFEDAVGWLVPDAARHRQTLHRGRSRRVLPRLLRGLPPVGVFVHDGLHTEATMRWELRAVTSSLAPRAAVLMDDAELNAAFADWGAANAGEWSLVETEFPGHLCGLALLDR